METANKQAFRTFLPDKLLQTCPENRERTPGGVVPTSPDEGGTEEEEEEEEEEDIFSFVVEKFFFLFGSKSVFQLNAKVRRKNTFEK